MFARNENIICAFSYWPGFSHKTVHTPSTIILLCQTIRSPIYIRSLYMYMIYINVKIEMKSINTLHDEIHSWYWCHLKYTFMFFFQINANQTNPTFRPVMEMDNYAWSIHFGMSLCRYSANLDFLSYSVCFIFTNDDSYHLIHDWKTPFTCFQEECVTNRALNQKSLDQKMWSYY